MSTLANLTAAVMEEKKTAAKRLTPVAGEVGAPLPATPAAFPNDMPTEVVQQKAGELRRIAAHLEEAAAALDALIDAPPPEKVVDIAAAQKAKEQQADFAANYNAQQTAAQDAVFGGQVPGSDGRTISNGGTASDVGWTCPQHGKAVEKTSERTGRTFMGCPDCNLFKR